MEREVVRIVTPGTITDEALLDERRDNVLASVFGAGGRFGLAWLDLSAGRFSVMEVAGASCARGGDRTAAPRRDAGTRRRAAALARPVRHEDRPWRPRAPWHFDARIGDARAHGAIPYPRSRRVSAAPTSRLAIAAAGALLAYVRETQKSALPHLLSITTEERDAALIMDPATRRNLELDESLAGKAELTLAGVFDRTATAMGGRLLRRWLHRPLRDRDTLRARYQAVATLHRRRPAHRNRRLAGGHRRSGANPRESRAALRAAAGP